MALSIIFGTAFEVSLRDEILESPRVRAYVISNDDMSDRAFIGHDTEEIVHVCNDACAQTVLMEWSPDALKTMSDGSYVSPSVVRTDGNLNYYATADVAEFDRGDDPYVTCNACGEELYRDDAAYFDMYGTEIGK